MRLSRVRARADGGAVFFRTSAPRAGSRTILAYALASAVLLQGCERTPTDPVEIAAPSGETWWFLPARVTDLRVTSVESSAVNLAFTQVSDGLLGHAKYELRYARAPIDWASATVVQSGPCAVPVAGTSVGATMSCPVRGLLSAVRYEFQVVARRQDLLQGTIYGQPSNVASGTTAPTAPPITITTGSLPEGRVGQSYSVTMQAQGGESSYSWSVASGTVPGGIALDAGGRLQGTPTAAGSYGFSVRVSSGAQSVTVPLQLLVQPPVAAGPAGADFEETWSYGSTSSMQANPNGWFAPDDYSDRAHGTIGLATGLSTPWGGAGALKITFFDRNGSGSAESMVGKNIVFPSWGNPREVWVQWFVRFDAHWTADFRGDGTNFDHKTLFYAHGSGGNRWETKFGKQGDNDPGGDVKIQIEGVLQDRQQLPRGTELIPVARSPHTTGPAIPAKRYFDGAWHEVYAHLKIESSPSANDGVYELWLDGQKVFEQIGIDTGSSNSSGGFTGLNLGRNLNQVPDQEQSFYFGRIRVWKSNPGLY